MLAVNPNFCKLLRMGLEKDLPAAERLVACLRPFWSNWSTRTCRRKRFRSTWTISGHWARKIIRDLNQDPSLRRKDIESILDNRIDEEGGPLVYAMESEEPLQRSLDSTCRRLYHFRSHSTR